MGRHSECCRDGHVLHWNSAFGKNAYEDSPEFPAVPSPPFSDYFFSPSWKLNVLSFVLKSLGWWMSPERFQGDLAKAESKQYVITDDSLEGWETFSEKLVAQGIWSISE